MKSNKTKLAKITVLALATLGMLAVPYAKANLSVNLFSAKHYNSYSSFSDFGNLICQFGRDGSQGGDLQSSYNCSPSFTSIQYCGGNYATQGTCLVLKDNYGGCYVWNINNWDGQEQIDCNIFKHRYGCDGIEIYGQCKPPSCNPPPCNPPPTTCVPEPTTFFAGALLLVPFGVQGVRQLRRRKPIS